MNSDDPAVLDSLRRCMVARIATLSRSGRPSITPLYFVCAPGRIWLGTSEWTRASRNVQADPRVSVLFEVERDPRPRRILRISGRASVRTDLKGQRSYNRRVARKYVPFARWHPPLSGPPAAAQAPAYVSRPVCRERPGLRHRGHPSACRVALGFAVRLSPIGRWASGNGLLCRPHIQDGP
jgi:general stress protein 26